MVAMVNLYCHREKKILTSICIYKGKQESILSQINTKCRVIAVVAKCLFIDYSQADKGITESWMGF